MSAELQEGAHGREALEDAHPHADTTPHLLQEGSREMGVWRDLLVGSQTQEAQGVPRWGCEGQEYKSTW